MGQAVTITPDQPTVTIMPDTAQGGTAATSANKGWLGSVGDYLGEAWKQVNPMQAVKSLAHPVDTASNMIQAQADVEKRAETSFKQGRYAEGVAHVINYLIPVIGPQMESVGDKLIAGQNAKAYGQFSGMLGNLAAPELAKDATIKAPVGQLPERMYQSALKPSTTMNPGQVQNVVKTGLENSVPVSELGAEKLNGLITDLNKKIQAQVASNPGATVNKFAVASRLSDTAKRFATQVNPEADAAAITESGNEFLRNQPGQIPATEAQALKQGTYQQLKGRAYGELKSATVESQKALARGIKEELNKQFPELADLNAKDSQLYQLDSALEKAVQRNSNHQLISFGTPAAAAAGGLATGTGAGAIAAAVLKKVIDDPIIKSKLAIALSKARGGVTIPAAASRLAAYSNALGAASQQRGDQTTGQ